MNKVAKRTMVSLLCLISAFGAAACGNNSKVDYSQYVVERTDYTSVYDKIGSKISVDMVDEKDDGTATVTYEGKTYELGMDFLSMAMVFNMKTSDAYPTKDDVYNQWWKLYMQRWNKLVPEVPLYSNQYYDLYNAKIQGFETTPYWGPAEAILSCTIKEGAANSVILGSATELSGAFRNSSFGKSSPGASDQDIQKLTTGYDTLLSNKEGAYEWASEDIVKSHDSKNNDDGTLTITIEIADDLKFSDGSAITAKNYLAAPLAGSSSVYAQASGSATAGLSYVGYEAFNAYDGTESDGASKYFSGIRLLSDYEFSVTIIEDYAQYYYSDVYAAFSPQPMKLYLGADGIDIKDDGEGCYIDNSFYETEEEDGITGFKQAKNIKANMNNWNKSDMPYSGPYVVENYNASDLTATLKKNPNFKGDMRSEGKPAAIETVSYVRIVSETQLDQFKTGQVDVLAGITGGDDTKAAIKLTEDEPTKYAETHYDRAGYGKLAFRCDFGPTQFEEVRQAIMYTIDRDTFAKDFTGGYGTVVDGPYYTGMAAYKANDGKMKLNKYTFGSDNAKEVLEAGGWIYDKDGKEYSGKGIRYKKLSGYELSYDNLHYASIDNKYRTVKVGDDFYMPLVINWYGTQPNDVTDMLVTAWQQSASATSAIGMYITYKSGDFSYLVYGDYCHMAAYGYNGTARCSAVNFATGFNSAVYDQSYYWTINPEYYDNYSNNYLMDQADFWADYQN